MSLTLRTAFMKSSPITYSLSARMANIPTCIAKKDWNIVSGTQCGIYACCIFSQPGLQCKEDMSRIIILTLWGTAHVCGHTQDFEMTTATLHALQSYSLSTYTHLEGTCMMLTSFCADIPEVCSIEIFRQLHYSLVI